VITLSRINFTFKKFIICSEIFNRKKVEKETFTPKNKKKFKKNSINRIFSPFFIKEFQRFSSKTKYYRAKMIVLTTSNNFVSTAFIVEIHIYVYFDYRESSRSIPYRPNEARICTKNSISRQMCPYVRDLIVRGIKFATSHDETQLKRLAPSHWSKSRDRKWKLPKRASRENRSQFSETFSVYSVYSPYICRFPGSVERFKWQKTHPRVCANSL